MFNEKRYIPKEGFINGIQGDLEKVIHTDAFGKIQHPFLDDMLSKYVREGLKLVRSKTGEDGVDTIVRDISNKHFAENKSWEVLKQEVTEDNSYINILLHHAFCENIRAYLDMEPEEFYTMLGRNAVTSKDYPMQRLAFKNIPSMHIFATIGKRSDSYVANNIVRFRAERSLVNGKTEKALLYRKSQEPYVDRLSEVFSLPLVLKFLKNDCYISQAFLKEVPLMHVGTNNSNLTELKCEVNGNECLYELEFDKQSLASTWHFYKLKLGIGKDAKELKRELKTVQSDLVEKRVSSNSSIVKDLEVLSTQMEEIFTEVKAYIKQEEVSVDYHIRLSEMLKMGKKKLAALGYSEDQVGEMHEELKPFKNGGLMDSLADIQINLRDSERRARAYKNAKINLFTELDNTKKLLYGIYGEAYNRGRLEEVLMYSIRMIERKDPYTSGHIQRVTNYSLQIAEYFGFSPEDLEDLEFEALFHDAGKILTPKSILTKSGKLSDFEFDVIREHSRDGYEMVRRIPVKKAERRAISLGLHHLYYNASGYPKQSVLHIGDQDVNSTIITIADAFDAITSNRIYDAARDVETAMKIIEKEAGNQFSPDVAEGVLHMYKEGVFNKIDSNVYRPRYIDIGLKD